MRRVATVIAAFGALTMSSGVALLATAPAADAAKNPVNICHATGSDSNPYVFITVDDDSVKLKGHLKHREDPNKKWKAEGTYEGVHHNAGDPKPDFIGSFTDDQGVFHEYDGDITSASCDGDVVTPLANADVDVTQPTCDNENTPSLDPVAQHATYVVSGSSEPGGHWVVTFTADDGYTFDGDDQTELVIEGDFDEAESPCDIVIPPTEVTPVAPEFTEPDCTTDPAVVLPDPAPVTETAVPEKKAAGPVIETKDVDGVHYVVTGSLEPGGTVDVDATAIDPNVLAEGVTTHWEHTFAEVGDCDVVDVPTETPSPTAVPSVATPTVVHAGLTGATVTNDLRSEQGLALLVSGMIMMVVAGGLGLRPVRGASRS
ncbi:MAG: hypothetical protein ACJ72L_02810 [Marmoricola sp.]